MTGVLEVVALLLLLVAASLRAAGSAVFELPRADAHHDAAEGVRGARMVADLLADRFRISSSVGMVGSALLVAAAAATVVSASRLESGPPLAAAVVGVSIFVVLIGDVFPRLVGRRRPRLVAYRLAPLLVAAVRLGGWAAEATVEENGNGNGEEDEADEDERALIVSVLRFSETVVREVMIPRPDMVTVSGDAGRDELTGAAIKHGYSRFPVVDESDVVGLVLVKDLLSVLADERGGMVARSVMRPAMFVPEVRPIAELLADMKASKTHMAMVVDEFGEISGLVTIEDLLEELVGEIVDETDDDEILVEELDNGRWRVDARLSVENLSEMLDIEFPEGDWDTVAGLVLGLAERVPEESESFEVDEASLTVARMQGRRVAEVIVTDVRQPAHGDTR